MIQCFKLSLFWFSYLINVTQTICPNKFYFLFCFVSFEQNNKIYKFACQLQSNQIDKSLIETMASRKSKNDQNKPYFRSFYCEDKYFFHSFHDSHLMINGWKEWKRKKFFVEWTISNIWWWWWPNQIKLQYNDADYMAMLNRTNKQTKKSNKSYFLRFSDFVWMSMKNLSFEFGSWFFMMYMYVCIIFSIVLAARTKSLIKYIYFFPISSVTDQYIEMLWSESLTHTHRQT